MLSEIDQSEKMMSAENARNARNVAPSLEEMSAWMRQQKRPEDPQVVAHFFGTPDDSSANTKIVEAEVRSASASVEGEHAGVDEQHLATLVRQLQDQGKDVTMLSELLEYFGQADTDHDGLINKKEVESFVVPWLVGDLKLATLYSEDPWQQSAARAEAVLAAGIGGEFAARFVADSYTKLDSWLKNNPGATPEMWKYAVGPLFFGETLRERLDKGLDADEMKSLKDVISQYGDDRRLGSSRYYQSAVPDLLKQAIELELHTPGTIDKNGDGKIDSREMMLWAAESKNHAQLNRLDQNGCTALGFAIADSVPNPEWPFFEDLGWADAEAFKKADKDGDNVINPSEMNDYFKSQVWRKFDFREGCFQHYAKPDSTSLEDVHWAQESADCFALADVGGKKAAELVADTLKGVENNWSKYAARNGGGVLDSISVEQYATALKTELSTALLARLSEGISYQDLKDYSEIAAGLKERFDISDDAFSKLVGTFKRAAHSPEKYDANGDGLVSTEELFKTQAALQVRIARTESWCNGATPKAS